MPSFHLITFILFSLFCYSACTPYKMSISQGNIVEQKDIDKLKPGMTKAQIRFVLGQPIIKDSFNSDTWYYIGTFLNGISRKYDKQELIANFKNNRLISLEGSFKLPPAFLDKSKKHPENTNDKQNANQ